jgi:hypothetical protein
MALKTFNVDRELYDEFSKHCRENGISMSKKISNFIREELERLKPRKVSSTKSENRVESKVEKINSGDEHPLGRYC